MPKQILPFKNTPSETNPLSQKSIVMPSMPNKAHFIVVCSAKWVNLPSEMSIKGASVRRLQAGAKIR